MADDIVQTIAEARVDARSLSEFVFKPAGFKVARRLAPPVDTLQFYIDRFDATVATIPNIVNDAINNTAVEGGVLADTFVTVTANVVGTVPRTQRDKNTDYITPKDFGATGNTEADLLGLSIIGLDTGGVIHTDNRNFTIAASDATDYDAITVGGAKLYINKEQTSFETRAEFVAAVEKGLKIKKDTVIQAGNVSYIYDKTSNDISDLPNFKPFGLPMFEHFGGAAYRSEPTHSTVNHYRNSENEILDVVRVTNPKPDTFNVYSHPDMDKTTGFAPSISLSDISDTYNVPVVINAHHYRNVTGDALYNVRPNGILIADGVAISGWDANTVEARNQAIICTKAGVLEPRYRSDGDAADYVAEGAVWGYSGGEWCVIDGVAVTIPPDLNTGTQRSGRTIVGQAANGDFITISAEGKTGSYGLTMDECAAVALEHGCVSAYISDGGGSSQLWWDNAYALPSSDNNFNDVRPICSGLGINCSHSTYDSGWIDVPLAGGFAVGNGVGFKVRQTGAAVNMMCHVTGTFTTSLQALLSNTTMLWRYTPTTTSVGRGILLGSGLVMGGWNFSGAGVSIKQLNDVDSTPYLAGTASWTSKHAQENTTP